MAGASSAQDSLPSFRAVIRSGKVILSWSSPYLNVVQLTVQRSPDSLKGYKSVATLPDPALRENGFLDNRAPDTRQFYRIYVQLQGGIFFTTPSKRAIPESEAPPMVRTPAVYTPIFRATPEPALESAQVIPTWNALLEGGLRPIIARRSRSSIRFAVNPLATDIHTLDVRIPNDLLSPSVFMFINPDGNVLLALPAARASGYRIQFYLPEGGPFFQISRPKEPSLIIDKVNFQRSGWFEFDVYEDDRLKERKRIFIPKTRQ